MCQSLPGSPYSKYASIVSPFSSRLDPQRTSCPVPANVSSSCDPHAMEGAARCMRVFAGCECGAGPAAAETTAGLAGMRCGLRGRLRLMRRVLRTVRNAAHPRTFRTFVDLDYRDTPRLDCRDAPPLEDSVRADKLPVSMRMHFCLLSRAAMSRML